MLLKHRVQNPQSVRKSEDDLPPIGLESAAVSSLFNWSNRCWSAGAGLSETLFDAGLRKATVQHYRAIYENTVAQYRQTVLTASQQAEDQFASLRILDQQVREQESAVRSAERLCLRSRAQVLANGK